MVCLQSISIHYVWLLLLFFSKRYKEFIKNLLGVKVVVCCGRSVVGRTGLVGVRGRVVVVGGCGLAVVGRGNPSVVGGCGLAVVGCGAPVVGGCGLVVVGCGTPSVV